MIETEGDISSSILISIEIVAGWSPSGYESFQIKQKYATHICHYPGLTMQNYWNAKVRIFASNKIIILYYQTKLDNSVYMISVYLSWLKNKMQYFFNDVWTYVYVRIQQCPWGFGTKCMIMNLKNLWNITFVFGLVEIKVLLFFLTCVSICSPFSFHHT